MIGKMLINSDDCEVLVIFEQEGSIEKTAKFLNKDPSGVSRQLLRIARTCCALEKVSGKWTLTQTGRKLSLSIREFVKDQKYIASQKSILRIGVNREFGSQVIGPKVSEIAHLFPNSHISISTFEAGTEAALLEGKVDISFDCEKPIDPSIGFKHLASDPIVAVCSPSFYSKNKVKIKSKKFKDLPHLLCERLYPHRIASDIEEINSSIRFNDIATTRAACLTGSGWALLPMYTIKREIEDKKLVRLSKKPWSSTKYGVWWPRGRSSSANEVEILRDWFISLNF